MLAQDINRYDFQRTHMGGVQVHLGCAALFVGLQEPTGAQAPSVACLEARKAVFGPRRAEVIADVFRKRQKFGCHHGADRVAAVVGRTGVAGPVAEEPRHRCG